MAKKRKLQKQHRRKVRAERKLAKLKKKNGSRNKN